jgi:hypothetical protein
MWPGNIGRWEVRSFMCRNWTGLNGNGYSDHRHWWDSRECDKIPELMCRKWRLDQITFSLLSFCRYLHSLSSKEHLGYWCCSVCRKRKSQRVYLQSWLAGMAVWLTTAYTNLRCNFLLLVPQTMIHDPQTFSVTICRGMTKAVTYYNTFQAEILRLLAKSIFLLLSSLGVASFVSTTVRANTTARYFCIRPPSARLYAFREALNGFLRNLVMGFTNIEIGCLRDWVCVPDTCIFVI